MVKEEVKVNKKIKLANIEIAEYCTLDIFTGYKSFRNSSNTIEFSGLYFQDKNNFFALYPTMQGPVMYYKKKEYTLKPELHISVEKMGDWREFHIEEYDIHIKYETSKYIGFDVWSEEEDVDLFYQIEQNYKKEEYYSDFTKDCFFE